MPTLVSEQTESDLWERGYALIPGAVDSARCGELRDMYEEPSLFRSRVVMARHHFGRGEYQYFAYPLPALVEGLRNGAYAQLAPIADRWNEALGVPARFPATQQQFLAQCFESEQRRPTALLLRYGAGDYNCLHQDVYGPVAFPFQLTAFLSEPGEDFDGGEFVLVEGRPRSQSRPICIVPRRGDVLIVPNKYRPVRGERGFYRTTFRHGVSEVRRGERFTLGIILHDAL